MAKVDIMYNPDIINSVLDDMEVDVNAKCAQMQKEAAFSCSSIRQSFKLELIKLPKDVKKMSLTRFREEFGDNIGNVINSTVGSNSEKGRTIGSKSTGIGGSRSGSFQTPSGKNNRSSALMSLETPGTSARRPKAGEMILSENGSPLGEYEDTVIKSNPNRTLAPPATPGIHVPMTNFENVDVNSMDQEAKDDALAKMQAMMNSMQLLMTKLQK